MCGLLPLSSQIKLKAAPKKAAKGLMNALNKIKLSMERQKRKMDVKKFRKEDEAHAFVVNMRQTEYGPTRAPGETDLSFTTRQNAFLRLPTHDSNRNRGGPRLDFDDTDLEQSFDYERPAACVFHPDTDLAAGPRPRHRQTKKRGDLPWGPSASR